MRTSREFRTRCQTRYSPAIHSRVNSRVRRGVRPLLAGPFTGLSRRTIPALNPAGAGPRLVGLSARIDRAPPARVGLLSLGSTAGATTSRRLRGGLCLIATVRQQELRGAP